jgi:hypothetical protein
MQSIQFGLKVPALTIEQARVIDFVTIADSGECLLTISDHLPWDDINKHLHALQEKIYAYLDFIEDGEVVQNFPEAAGRSVVIDIVMKFAAPADVQWFFDKIREPVEAAGASLAVHLFQPIQEREGQ